MFWVPYKSSTTTRVEPWEFVWSQSNSCWNNTTLNSANACSMWNSGIKHHRFFRHIFHTNLNEFYTYFRCLYTNRSAVVEAHDKACSFNTISSLSVLFFVCGQSHNFVRFISLPSTLVKRPLIKKRTWIWQSQHHTLWPALEFGHFRQGMM